MGTKTNLGLKYRYTATLELILFYRDARSWVSGFVLARMEFPALNRYVPALVEFPALKIYRYLPILMEFPARQTP